MAMMSKTRDILEGLLGEGSFKWGLSRRTSFNSEDEFEDTSGRRKWISELSPIANVIVARCSRILEVSMDDLQQNFDVEASEPLKNPSNYARNFLEYCCFRALALSLQVMGHLSDKNFRRLTFDMMLAWEAPSASSQPVLKQVEKESTVGLEAFSRIAPAIPTIADVVTCSNVFEFLTRFTGGQLTFAVYDKYIGGLDRAAKQMKKQTESSLISGLRSGRGERILEVDGTLPTQPVLEHIGISAWPGRLTLTDYAFYFEALRVVSYDKAKVYELADDLKQVLKPELTGPLGSRLFDKAVMYKSTSISEPVMMEFPELGGHSRRDYWLAIMREVLYAHRFIRKFQINGVEKEETLSKAVLGILRLQAIQDLGSSVPLRFEELLMFNLCDQLPGGDIVLEALAETTARMLDRSNQSHPGSGMHSLSASAILSSLGFSSQVASDGKLLVGDIVVSEMTPLERAVKESKNSYKMMEHAQSTIDGVKADGIAINVAVMQELVHPLNMLVKNLLSLAYWDDPLKSILFCSVSSYIIFRGWLVYLPVVMLLVAATFMLLTRCLKRGRAIDQIRVKAPPTMNPMEQLLALQSGISKLQEFVQDTNIILLKLRALLLTVPSKVGDKTMVVLVAIALTVAFLPSRFLHLLIFMEIFTIYSPPRRASTERSIRRLKEWWFSIPAAPVLVERDEEKKKK